MDSTVSTFQLLLGLIGSNPWSSILSTVGLVLFCFGVAIGTRALKSDPLKTPFWLKFGLYFCLIIGVLFSATGPLVALMAYLRNPIEKVSVATAFGNLETNARITWAIRLIPFDPETQPQLAIGQLKQIGPSEQKYTFVGVYDELVGYGVDDAVRMLGGTYYSPERVSAIIFPLAGRQIYPANARGLLQVIQNIETDEGIQISNSRLLAPDALSLEESSDLKNTNALNFWRFDSYFQYYPHYCRLAQTFRCDKRNTYSAHAKLGGPNIDWHPLGFAKKNTQHDPCDDTNYCAVSDANSAHRSWQAAEAKMMMEFGGRAFLMDNLSIDTIKDRVLIDFGEPERQFIPDIGLSRNR